MDKYDIIIVPDPVLKTRAEPVGKVDDEIRKQMDRMLSTMYDAPGIGLAANQVNLLNRVLVMDTSQRNEETQAAPVCMANPEIVWRSEEISVMEEGCLSIPQQYAEVERPAKVIVSYLDYEGEKQEASFEDLDSHCVQHEIDHLNGVLFIDYLSRVKRDMMVRRVQKLKKQGEIL
jgi:peptide deformylase